MEALVERVLTARAPYRLDLTVAVLRRFSTNLVDVMRPDGTYVRALSGFGAPAIVSVRQTGPTELVARADCLPGDEERCFALVPRMLGTDLSVATFDRGARTIPWLRDLAKRMRGVKPPRYATLWEACVNAIVYQVLSLDAAGAILRRAILATGEPIERDGVTLHAFPTIAALTGASNEILRATGLSINKITTLRRVGEALETGALDEVMLEERSSAEASALLCSIKGIGPWTAAVILLRGLNRLDVFPANDSGVAKGLRTLAGDGIDVADALARLGDERGMLYFHLLLARLERTGEVS